MNSSRAPRWNARLPIGAVHLPGTLRHNRAARGFFACRASTSGWRFLTVTLPILLCLNGAFTASALGVGRPKMIWSDRGSNTIRRADLDGGNVETLVSGLGEARGVAVDWQHGRLYWVDNGTNKIQRSRLDGSQQEDLVTSGLDFPAGIVLDVPNGTMYWADAGTNKIQRADLDGANVADVVTGLGDPYFITLDPIRQHLYWTDYGTDKIQRSNLDGSQVTDLVTTGLSLPRGIVLDLDHDRMYWADRQTDLLQRADLNGQDIETLHQATPSSAAPHGVALDLPRGHLYWVDNGLVTIKRSSLDGADVVTILDRTSGVLSLPWQIVLDARETIGGCAVATPCGPEQTATEAAFAIDTLTQQLGQTAAGSPWDYDGDQVLSAADRDFLLRFIFNTQPGDANLDGYFSTDDLVDLFVRGEFEDGIAGNSGWADGDWTGDGEFDTADLVVAFQEGYDGERVLPSHMVPEPGAACLLGLGVLMLSCRPRLPRTPAHR